MFTQFRHNLLEKYVGAFGSLFANIRIVRPTAANTVLQTLAVPLTFGQKDKIFSRLQAAPTSEEMTGQVATTFPRLAFELVGMTYAPGRKLPTTRHQRYALSSQYGTRLFVPVPYDLTFTVSTFAKTASDSNQIIEQILPYFTPSYTVNIKVLNDLGVTHEIPILLETTHFDDSTQANGIADRRVISWSLQFRMHAWFYGPATSRALIREVQVDTHFLNTTAPEAPSDILMETGNLVEMEDRSGQILNESSAADLVTPRVTRVKVTPDPLDAEPADNYEYTTAITYYNDGAVFNPVTGNDDVLS
jgi:hypothetical protein